MHSLKKFYIIIVEENKIFKISVKVIVLSTFFKKRVKIHATTFHGHRDTVGLLYDLSQELGGISIFAEFFGLTKVERKAA